MKNNVFSLFYYSQIQLVLIAVALTAATSAVLLKSITSESLWIVGLSTFATYSIDNLIDWKQDIKYYQNIKRIIPYYHKFCYAIVPICLLGIGFLVLTSNSRFQIGIMLLGATVLITIIRLPIFNKVLTTKNDFTNLLWNRVFISLIWAAVCVFTPVWYANQHLTPQTWMTYAYLTQLIFIDALLWKLEKSPEGFITENNLSFLSSILQYLCTTSILLAIVDVLLGYFPLYNLVVVLAPLVNLFVIRYWRKFHIDLRIIFTILVFTQIMCSFLTAFVHLRN